MRVEDLGEFGLIARLTDGLVSRADVVLAAGDDAALLEPEQGTLIVATCDTQVEGRHFVRGVATPEQIGHKALAVNLSDIAAMGAAPRWALISLLVPPALEVAVLDGIYAGMNTLAGRFGVALVGGNVSAVDGLLIVDVTLLGTVRRGLELRRSGAAPGDHLLVTGTLGAAAAGLLALVSEPGAAPIEREALDVARTALVAPSPRVVEGLALASCGGVSAMLDISDGLAADLGHLCAASQVGARVDAGALPVDDAARQIAAAYGRDSLSFALHGGEDYQLLCTVRPDALAAAQTCVAAAGGSAHDIGVITAPEAGLRLRMPGGSERPLAPRGWDHLRAGGNE